MTEFPLFDLATQFQTDVQAISADFKSGVLSASNNFVQNMTTSREVADLRVETASSPSPNREVGMQRLEQTIAVASPLKHSKQESRATPTPPPAVSPMLSINRRQGETSEQFARIEVRKMPSLDGKTSSAPKTPTSVGLLASASPRPGLLDRMHARGIFSSGSTGTPPNPTLVPAANVVAAERGRTLERSRSSGESGLESSRMSEEGRRPASLDKAPLPCDTPPSPSATRSCRSELPLSSPVAASPSSQPKAKRQRENSMVALYKAMVEPQLQIETCSSEASLLKGKVLSAKKFRRSSMLKKAAIVSPAPIIAQASTPPTTPQVPIVAASSVVPPDPIVPSVAASPEKNNFAVPKTPVSKPATKQKTKAGPTGSQRPAKKQRPPVPSFSSPPIPQPCQLLRLTPLSPKRDEDNYEISDKDENSDEEIEPDRSHKHVPKWCASYLQLLAAQSSTDPDSIFGSKVPHCDLEAIFSIETYKRFGRDRPQRRRGSSGEWKKDRLRPGEISEYKQKMGQSEPWRAKSKNIATSSSN